ncbi:MAG: aminoglycoside 3-N-acetyltransferase [Candidatus Eremiobacteraeota bacterium]|jgi:aminoglycoside 3-N-acetyltransferase I|nr:aminoglycoside 3-N-acetyltransferase [Candidatus Eremiobacteraeota bacterium]
MACNIRRLTGRDVPAMRELTAMFSEAFEDSENYESRPPSDAYLRTLLDRPDVIVLSAYNETSAPVGGLVAYVLAKFEQERSEAYIYDLAVAQQHRRRGIATDLIRALRRIARELGVYVIFVQADPPDAPAVALYESLGSRDDVFHFDIPV